MSLQQAVAALDKILENPNFAKENSKSNLPMQYACLTRPVPPILDIKTDLYFCRNRECHRNNDCQLSNADSVNSLNSDNFGCPEKSIKFPYGVASYDGGDELSSVDDSYDEISDCSSLIDYKNSGSSLRPHSYSAPAHHYVNSSQGVELLQIEATPLQDSNSGPNISLCQSYLGLCANPGVTLNSLGNIHEGFVPLDPKKYKTELCRSYHVHGYCKYGISRCNYAHGISQLKISFRHGKYKTRNCQSYHETGTCRYGARCSFIHDPEEGILKCPITDREILEALHCFPLEHRSVANITWKVVDGSFSQSELYFFSNPPPFPWPSLTKSNYPCSSLFDLDISKLGEDWRRRIKPISSSMDDLASSEGMSTDQTVKKSGEKVECSLDAKEETDVSSREISSNAELISPKISEEVDIIEPKNTKHVEARLYEKLPLDSSRKSQESDAKSGYYSADIAPTFEHRGTCTKTSFSLSDFLRCLKTKEGEQHLASWSPEPQKTVCKLEPEEPPPKQKKATAKVEMISRTRDMTKYKTELCRSYQYNKYCEYGDTCLYAHGQIDLRSYPKHPMYRTKKCYSFHYKGFCLYGSRCQFLHDISF